MIEKYNHKRPLSDFQDSINLLKEHGFNPIAVTQLFMEDTFVFETKEEAAKAYNLLEIEKELLQGWFYGKSDFEKAVLKYEKDSVYSDTSYKVLVYKLK